MTSTPPLMDPALLAPEAGIVVVAPHPDDEVIGVGGQLAAWAARGRRVRIVAVTDGEASHRDRWRRDETELAATRRAESARGWQQLGFSPQVARRLHLPDGALQNHEGLLVERLCDELEPGDAVFATWRLDGHPDHEATGRAAARACALRGCSLFEYPVWMWHWALPADPRVPWARLRRVALSPHQQASKALALAEHASQLEAREGHGAVLPADLLVRWLRPYECLFLPLPE